MKSIHYSGKDDIIILEQGDHYVLVFVFGNNPNPQFLQFSLSNPGHNVELSRHCRACPSAATMYNCTLTGDGCHGGTLGIKTKGSVQFPFEYDLQIDKLENYYNG